MDEMNPTATEQDIAELQPLFKIALEEAEKTYPALVMTVGSRLHEPDTDKLWRTVQFALMLMLAGHHSNGDAEGTEHMLLHLRELIESDVVTTFPRAAGSA